MSKYDLPQYRHCDTNYLQILYLQIFIFNWVANQSLVPDSFKIHLLLYKQNHFGSHKICNTALLCLLIFCVLFIHWSCLKKQTSRLYLLFKWVIRHTDILIACIVSLHLLYHSILLFTLHSQFWILQTQFWSFFC